MATRKQTTKPTITGTPFTETVHSAAPDTEDTLNARLHAAIDEMFKGSVVSWKRIAVAWIIGLAAGFGASYVMTALVTYAVVGAMLLSGSVFITNLVYIMGLIITFYASYRASIFVHLKIIDRSVDELIANASHSVRSLFGNKHVAS